MYEPHRQCACAILYYDVHYNVMYFTVTEIVLIHCEYWVYMLLFSDGGVFSN